MPEDSARMEPAGIAQADLLYRGFPSFAAWGELSAGDADLWSRFAAGLEKRRLKASPESLRNAVEVAVRAAALDTGAIEGLYSVDRGFTMTVAVQGLAWQPMIDERGAGVRELFEAQLAAYELVLDAATQDRPITEVWIRNLHETLCAPQRTYRVLTDVGWQEQELPKGQYKTRPNHVRLADGTFHAYAPVDRVADELHRLVEQIRMPELAATHPVLQASYCHYAFVMIHPFADGNGRVARALASTFFYRAQSIPLVIFANQRPAYLDALALADRGDMGALISFFLDRGIDTMQLVAESLVTAAAPKPEDLAKRLSKASRTWRELSKAELETISDRILREHAGIFIAKVRALRSESLSAEWEYYSPTSDTSTHEWCRLATTRILLRSSEPRRKFIIRLVSVYWSLSPKPFPFLVSDGYKDSLEARLEDVLPELSPHFHLRLDQCVQRQLGNMLKEIAEKEGS